MCFVLHPDGHLDVDYFHEQVWPRREHDSLVFDVCLDVVARNVGSAPILGLSILSPYTVKRDRQDRSLYTVGVSALAARYDWIFGCPPFHRGDNRFSLSLNTAGSSGDGLSPAEINVIHVEAIPRDVELNLSEEFQSVARGALEGVGFTLVRVDFPKGQELLQCSLPGANEPRYWLRIKLTCEVDTFSNRGLSLQLGGINGWDIAPCWFFSGDQVLRDLSDRLKVLSERAYVHQAVEALKAHLWDVVFGSDDSSVRVLEHYMSVVTCKQMLVLNSAYSGRCAFRSADPVRLQGRSGQTIGIGRTYVTGALHFPHGDPLCLARLVFQHLRKYATTTQNSKSKEEITAALGLQDHRNVSFVVDILVQNGFVEAISSNQFKVLSENGNFDVSIFSHLALEIRNRLYSRTAVAENSSNGWSQSSSFRVDFDLASVHTGANG